MAKVSYRPKKNQGKQQSKRQEMIERRREETYEQEEIQFVDGDTEEIQNNLAQTPKISVANNKRNQNKLDNIKVIGDLECEYHVYIEDYAYTYIYQLAATDLTKEISAALIGEIFTDSKEIIVRAVIPIDMDKLKEMLEKLELI